MKKAPLAPHQYIIFSMARILLVLDVWEDKIDTPITAEKLMLFDFVIQYPREIIHILPDLKITLAAEDLDEVDLSDVFAKRSLENINERFNETLSCLTARNLVVQEMPTETNPEFKIKLSGLGKERVKLFQTPMSKSIREISIDLVNAWHKKNPSKLLSEIFSLLPDQSDDVINLSTPFEVWENGK